MKIRCLYDGRFKLAEGPVWCDRTGAVWWVNMVEPSAVYRLFWNETEPQMFPAPRPVTGVALTADNLVLAGTVGGLMRLDPRSGALDPVIRLDGDKAGNRCNEIGVDPHGNLWVGTMSNNLMGASVDPEAGALFRIDPDGQQRRVVDRVGIPNTLVWDAEGRLFTADSLTGMIRRIMLGASGEALKTEHFHGPVDVGVPDGSALAVDGTLWTARWSAGCLIGIAPDGIEVKRIPLPGGNITSACFAGPKLDTLLVTTSCWGLSETDLTLQPQAGGIFVIEDIGIGTPGTRFAARVGTWPIIGLD